MPLEAPAAAVEQPVKSNLTAGQRFAEKLAAAPAEPITPEVPATPPPASPVSEPVEPDVETPAETTETPEPELSFVEQAKALGFENLTEADAHQRVLEYVAQMREQNARLEAERQQLLALRQPVAPAATTQTNEAPKPWVPPSIDRTMVAEYREAKIDPATGKQVAAWKEGTPPAVIQQVQQFEQWQKQWAEALTTRPHEVLTEMMRNVAAEVASQQYTQQAQTLEVQNFKQKVLTDNPWLFESDPLTKRPTQNLSVEGQRMYSYCEEAVNLGITQPQAQWRYAEQQRELAMLRSKSNTSTAAQTANQINAQQKQATTNASLAAKGIAAPTNNIPQPRSQARPLTAGQRFAALAAKEGASI